MLSACSYRPAIRSNEGSLEPKHESVEEAVPSDQSVDFEGVSFTYDPRVFGDVKKEVVPEHKLEDPTDKPDYVEPKNVRFDFEFARRPSEANARIAVYPLDQFDDAYSISPHMVGVMKERITGLQKALKDPSFRLLGQIPHLEFADASDDLYVKIREFDFPSGDGIIFVTHWNSELSLISNRNLVYRFEGITADGKYYVTAETPVSVAFLPDDSPLEFEGYTDENLYYGNSNSRDSEARIEKYRNSIATRLEKLNSNEFSPNLEKFEAIISSLKITK
jgi:hypothetical protein